MNSTNNWFQCRSERPDAALRLFTLPFAGGGASAFNAWPSNLPDSIELNAVQLPGRESRFRETPFTDIYTAAKALADAIEPHLDRPYALFGYSMGALIAFELARELRRRGAQLPVQLFVAARRAPQTPPLCPSLVDLPLDQFLEKMRDCYDPPKDAWELPELLEIILPTLRTDMAMCDGYHHHQEPPFDCPIVAFAGTDDQSSPPEVVDDWRQETSGDFNLEIFEGGHFFINTALAEVQGAVTSHLEQIIQQIAPNAHP